MLLANKYLKIPALRVSTNDCPSLFSWPGGCTLRVTIYFGRSINTTRFKPTMNKELSTIKTNIVVELAWVATLSHAWADRWPDAHNNVERQKSKLLQWCARHDDIRDKRNKKLDRWGSWSHLRKTHISKNPGLNRENPLQHASTPQ